MKTTLRKLVSEIDKDATETSVNWEGIASEFGIELYWSDDKQLKCYFIQRWQCTDTHVGMKAYFLNDEFVALSYQPARKSSTQIGFVSTELALKVRDYLLSLCDQYDPNFEVLEGLDEEIENTFSIEYNSQILHEEAILNGERVKIGKTTYPYSDNSNHFHTVEVIKMDGSTLEVDCRKLRFEFNK